MTREPQVDAARRKLGIADEALLGEGGESVVFALDVQRVARIHRPGTRRDHIEARNGLLAELAPQRDRVPFAIPEVLESREVEGCLVCIEPRIPGQAMATTLRTATGSAREALVRAYLDAAAAIGALAVDRSFCGDLCRWDPVRAETPAAWARERVDRDLAAAGPDFAAIDAATLAAALPPPKPAALVHMDVFPGNVLCEGERITAVIDFGTLSARADPQLDPLLATVFLQESISGSATDADRAVASAWLGEHGLGDFFAAAERWTAAFWTVAPRDTPLYAWARSRLLG